MLLAGIPMYICATTSTPISATLVPKGYRRGPPWFSCRRTGHQPGDNHLRLPVPRSPGDGHLTAGNRQLFAVARLADQPLVSGQRKRHPQLDDWSADRQPLGLVGHHCVAAARPVAAVLAENHQEPPGGQVDLLLIRSAQCSSWLLSKISANSSTSVAKASSTCGSKCSGMVRPSPSRMILQAVE